MTHPWDERNPATRGVPEIAARVWTGLRRSEILCALVVLADWADDAGLTLVLEPVALALDLDDLGVMEQAVEHGRRQHTIAGEGLADPRLRSIGSTS